MKIPIRNLYKYQFTGRIPQPDPKEAIQAESEWNFRIDAASFMLGLSEAQIEKKAKEDYESEPGGTGRLGNEKWDKNCEPSRKFSYISAFLPNLNILKNQYTHRYIILTEPDSE